MVCQVVTKVLNQMVRQDLCQEKKWRADLPEKKQKTARRAPRKKQKSARRTLEKKIAKKRFSQISLGF